MTNVLLLPQQTVNFAFSTNSDWRYSWTFLNTSNAPIDITGIVFHMQVRSAAGAFDIALDISTTNGLLVNNGTTGVLSLDVPETVLKSVPPGSYVTDLIAEGDGNTVNLYVANPATVTVSQGITTP